MTKKRLSGPELRDAAMHRLTAERDVREVGSLFATSGTRSPAPQTYRLPVVRCSSTLGQRIARYGNRHNLSVSETIRRLIEIGLDNEGEP